MYNLSLVLRLKSRKEVFLNIIMEHLQSGLGTTLFSSFSWVQGQMCFMMLLSSVFSFTVFDFTEKCWKMC